MVNEAYLNRVNYALRQGFRRCGLRSADEQVRLRANSLTNDGRHPLSLRIDPKSGRGQRDAVRDTGAALPIPARRMPAVTAAHEIGRSKGSVLRQTAMHRSDNQADARSPAKERLPLRAWHRRRQSSRG